MCRTRTLAAPEAAATEEEEVSHPQVVDLRPHEAAIGVLWRAHDRLPPDIEAGVREQAVLRPIPERPEQFPVSGVRLVMDGLQASGEIDLRHGRTVRADVVQLLPPALAPVAFGQRLSPLFPYLRDQQHVG